MATTNISIRIDTDLKTDAENLFSEFGMNITTAFNIFVRQAVREQRIPFEITKIPNETTRAAMYEAKRIANDPSVKGYSNIEELLAELQEFKNW